MISLTSTLQDILNEFVMLSADYDPANAQVLQDGTWLKVLWPDTSRVRLDISVLSIIQGGVAMVVPPPIDVEGGTNPNNPPQVPPVLSALNPSTIASAGSGFDLVITGTGFIAPSQVYFGTAVGDAQVDSDTQVTMHVGPDGYALPGTVNVTVAGPGGIQSNALPFTIT
jgi:hypothetical protein